jgi:hypothetical protein
MNYKIIDNFLEKNLFDNIKNTLFNSEMPWFWRSKTTPNKKDSFYFTHSFYKDYKINSSLFEICIIPFLNQLNCLSLIEVRANLTVNRNKEYCSSYHTDYNDSRVTTSIFYLNNCDSETILFKKNPIKIKSKENRILIFDATIDHSAIYKQNVDRRIILNFNYIKK